MTKTEKKILLFLESKKELFFFVIITLLGAAIRFKMKDFVTDDFELCLLPWYRQIQVNGGLAALGQQVGNYGIPYQFLIALLTYIPIDALYLYKAVSVIFDFALAAVSAAFVCSLRQEKSKSLFLTVYAVTLFVPTIIMNSSAWAQCDSIYTFFIVLALYYLHRNKNFRAFLFIGIAFSFKLQTIFIVPFLIYYIINEKKTSVLWGGSALLGFYILQVPGLVMKRPVLEPFYIYYRQTGYYIDMWKNFPSFWALLGKETLTFRGGAVLLTMAILGIGLWLLMNRPINMADPQIFMKMLIWSVWTCLLFLPSMHERYAYPLDLLLLLCVFLDRKSWKYAVVAILCSVFTYSIYLFEHEVNLELLSVIFFLAYLSYSWKEVLPLLGLKDSDGT